MKLIKQRFEIVGTISAEDMLKNLEFAGRICYKSENPNDDFELTKKFVKGIIARGHLSVLEHEKLSVHIVCNRGVTHELVRHRIASYSQESTRYCDYSGGHVTYIIPNHLLNDIDEGEFDESNNINLLQTFVKPDASKEKMFGIGTWLQDKYENEKTYKELRAAGWAPQEARDSLPIALKTEIVITANLREWRHIFNLRAVGTTGKPHPQMVEVMEPLLKYMKEAIPVIFDDIG